MWSIWELHSIYFIVWVRVQQNYLSLFYFLFMVMFLICFPCSLIRPSGLSFHQNWIALSALNLLKETLSALSIIRSSNNSFDNNDLLSTLITLLVENTLSNFLFYASKENSSRISIKVLADSELLGQWNSLHHTLL